MRTGEHDALHERRVGHGRPAERQVAQLPQRRQARGRAVAQAAAAAQAQAG